MALFDNDKKLTFLESNKSSTFFQNPLKFTLKETFFFKNDKTTREINFFKNYTRINIF